MAFMHVVISASAAVCSVAAPDSTAELLGCIEGLLWEFGTVTFVSVGVPGVCSVAGLIVAVRFLAVLPSSCGRFPKVGSKNAMAAHARSIRSACIDIAVKILHRSCWLRTPRGTCQSMIERLSMSKASAMVAISWADGALTALTRQWSDSQ